MSSLYLHIPFCRRKCPYCDFYSLTDRPVQRADYHQYLLLQLQLASGAGWLGPFQSIYFGGGTPSLLEPGQVGILLEAVAAGPGLTSDCEISLEANPATLDAQRLSGYRQTGVNRISLGVQSFSEVQLRRLGRLHSADQAVEAAAMARRAGFDNLSCDLMFGLPGQSLENLTRELGGILDLEPEHVSIYGLSIEPESVWGREKSPVPVDERTYAAGYGLIAERLVASGYAHYEISNYARPGYASRHNLGYWRRHESLGLGAGAHGFRLTGWGERWETPADLDAFRCQLQDGRDPMRLLERFDRRGAMAETLYLGLRTAEGVDDEAFTQRFGITLEEAFATALARTGNRVKLQAGRWRIGSENWLLYDHLIADFL